MEAAAAIDELLIALSELWTCFPLELSRAADDATERRAHLSSAAFRQAPRKARACAALLSGLAGTYDAAVVDGLIHELRARAWDGGAPLEPSAVQLQRSLFLCAVVLLLGALGRRRAEEEEAWHAEAALCSLADLSVGAVAVTELELLERLLLERLLRAGRLAALLPLAAPEAAPMTAALEARRRLVLRWVERALWLPAAEGTAVSQLQPQLSQFLALATGLPNPQQPSAGLLRGALARLCVEDEAQLAAAAELVAGLRGACSALLEHEATLGPPPPQTLPQPAGRTPPLSPPHAAAELCPLLFTLVTAVKEPLLPLLLAGAEGVALGARTEWQRARCVRQVQDAVSHSFNFYRKQRLVQWALCLQRRLGELALSSKH